MATPQSAMQKYARKTGTTGVANWEKARPRMEGNYASGLARFGGRSPDPSIVAAYRDGIHSAAYRGGDPEKWLRNYMAKVFGA